MYWVNPIASLKFSPFLCRLPTAHGTKAETEREVRVEKLVSAFNEVRAQNTLFLSLTHTKHRKKYHK